MELPLGLDLVLRRADDMPTRQTKHRSYNMYRQFTKLERRFNFFKAFESFIAH